MLLGNKSYLLLCSAYTLLYGVYTSLGAVVAAITEPYGFKSVDNAIFGGIFIFSGVAGSFILGIALDKTSKYKMMIMGTSFGAILFIGLSFFTLPSMSTTLFAINLVFVGFCVIPIIPIGLSFAVELTFPVPEAMSNGMMILPSQIFGSALVRFLCIQPKTGSNRGNRVQVA